MSAPIEVELPHQLGKAEAKRRIAGNMHKLSGFIPGGVADVQEDWTDDHLRLAISAMGQEVVAAIDVEDALVKCRIDLPPLLGMFRDAFESAFRKHGQEVLLEDHSKD
ncbi:polyhydroxyalkanoic acid system family protein [Sphingomicrobium sediminis]|uniref:Polyhydroxyalkanoic acid system family protein n=1 Tax=Sphingomicrobium sediminis TaxID=2950949 RepID=A0A9X2EHV1_9SPHN|nr:polyhydroxyalkanoic acid system family protein [Sphingomicrobium sediminis]MCM8557825.1 polyhydroxyalkanoic acid system family protein [Sphingomicrobium sediminis]